jgi:ribonucleotide monophosphatase NagD (HAD superfamily)
MCAQVPEALSELRKRGKKILFVSNNATKHRSQYMEKFEKMKIDANFEDVVSSAFGAASYFVKQHGKGAKVYACGTQVWS